MRGCLEEPNIVINLTDLYKLSALEISWKQCGLKDVIWASRLDVSTSASDEMLGFHYFYKYFYCHLFYYLSLKTLNLHKSKYTENFSTCFTWTLLKFSTFIPIYNSSLNLKFSAFLSEANFRYFNLLTKFFYSRRLSWGCNALRKLYSWPSPREKKGKTQKAHWWSRQKNIHKLPEKSGSC